MKKGDKKQKNWFVRNKKILYWPLGGIIYISITLSLSFLIPKLASFFIAILNTFAFFMCKIVIWHCGSVFNLVFTLISFEIFLFLLGFTYNRFTKLWHKLVFLILFLILILILLIFDLTRRIVIL